MGKRGPKPKWTEETLFQIEQLLITGKTLQEVGDLHKLSKQRIEQIIRKSLPHLTKQDYGSCKKTKLKKEEKAVYIQKRYNRSTWKCMTDLEKAQAGYFTRKNKM